MITDLQSSVTDISSEQLDKLFEQTPDNQVNADSLVIPIHDEKKVITISSNQEDIPEIDLEKLDAEEKVDAVDDKKDDVAEEKVEDKKEDKADDSTKKDAKKDKKDAAEDKKDEPTEDEIKARNEFLKNSVNFLIEKGLFKDFEGREDLEVNDEVFAQLLEKQIEKQIDDRYESKKKSAGEIGESLLEYLENGGDPDKIIDLFKETKSIEEFPVDDEASQSELISKYYKEVHGWKPEKIKKYLNSLNSEEGALESEADEIKSKFKEQHQRQLEALQEQQRGYQEEQKRRQKTFETNINKVIDSNKDFDLKRKKFIKDSIFKLRTMDDGSQVNEFYLKFAEWQNDPEKYIELAEFILDKEGYIKRKSIDIENKVVAKTFNFIKGNSAVNKNKGSRHVENTSDSNSGTDFSVIFK